MIPRSHFINKIRSLGYSYVSRLKRTDSYKKTGSTQHYIFMRQNKELTEEFVKSALTQAGCKPKEIEEFIASAKA